VPVPNYITIDVYPVIQSYMDTMEYSRFNSFRPNNKSERNLLSE